MDTPSTPLLQFHATSRRVALARKPLLARLRALAACDSGATAIEYALIVALISVTIIPPLRDVGFALQNTFIAIDNALRSALSKAP